MFSRRINLFHYRNAVEQLPALLSLIYSSLPFRGPVTMPDQGCAPERTPEGTLNLPILTKTA